MKLSFKKQKRETGLSAVGHGTPDTTIKGDKICVGIIHAPTWMTKDNKFGVSLAIKKEETPADPAGFRWITFKARFDTDELAREWVTRNWAALCEKYDLYQLEGYGED